MTSYPFRRTCKEVASLVVAREDRNLNVTEKLALRTHMLICKACPGFERQVLTMRNAMHQWRHYTGDAETATPSSPANAASPVAASTLGAAPAPAIAPPTEAPADKPAK